jgi:hypothetical protein
MLLRQNELGRRKPSGRRSGGTEALKALENGAIAPLRNVGLFGELVDKVQRRAQHLPGLACFYGHSGYGKTRSAVLAANRRPRVVCRDGRDLGALKLMRRDPA